MLADETPPDISVSLWIAAIGILDSQEFKRSGRSAWSEDLVSLCLTDIGIIIELERRLGFWNNSHFQRWASTKSELNFGWYTVTNSSTGINITLNGDLMFGYLDINQAELA